MKLAFFCTFPGNVIIMRLFLCTCYRPGFNNPSTARAVIAIVFICFFYMNKISKFIVTIIGNNQLRQIFKNIHISPPCLLTCLFSYWFSYISLYFQIQLLVPIIFINKIFTIPPTYINTLWKIMYFWNYPF